MLVVFCGGGHVQTEYPGVYPGGNPALACSFPVPWYKKVTRVYFDKKKSIVRKLTTTTTMTMIPNPNHGWSYNTETLFTNRASVIAAGHVGAIGRGDR